MTSEELFYDHYKDSFEQQKGYLKERNRLTLYLVLLVALIFLLTGNRSLLMEASATLQEQKLGRSFVDFSVIASALYFVFLWISMRYYQINLTIERTYDYISDCEAKLSKGGDYKIKREGSDYEKKYPWLKWVVHRIYVYVFPILIVVASVLSIVQECGNQGANRFLDIVFLSFVVILSILYLLNRIFGK